MIKFDFIAYMKEKLRRNYIPAFYIWYTLKELHDPVLNGMTFGKHYIGEIWYFLNAKFIDSWYF